MFLFSCVNPGKPGEFRASTQGSFEYVQICLRLCVCVHVFEVCASASEGSLLCVFF